MVLKTHNHLSDYENITKIKALHKIKQSSITKCDPPKSIITNISPSLSDATIQLMPKYKSLRDNIRRSRAKNMNIPLYFDEIPESLRFNLRGERFFRFDSGVYSEDRYVIFYSDFASSVLKKTKSIIIDGTFYSVPRDFYQLIIIYGNIFNKSVALAYILATSKTELIYINIFKFIRENTLCNPEYITIDFELALKNSLNKVFPLSKINACIFHFGQMIWRQIQKHGLTNSYLYDVNIRKTVKMFMCLVFVPKNEALNEFTRIMKGIDDRIKRELDDILLYFKRMYIGVYKENILIKEPLYCADFWSLHDNIVNLIPRSINSAEAFHRNLNKCCQTAHPNLAKFITILQREDECNRIKIIQDRKCFKINIKRLEKNFNLKIICENFYSYENFEFYEILDKIYDWNMEK